MIPFLAVLALSSMGTGDTMDLSGWVSTALSNSPALAEAEASLSMSRAGLKSAGSFIWPTLTFTASSGYSWISAEPVGEGHVGNEAHSLSLGLSQELLGSGGRSWLLLGAERRGFQAAEADYDAAVLDIVMRVLEAYYAVVEAEGLLSVSAQALERSASQLERAQALYAMGGITTLEMLQLQVQESRSRLALTRGRQGVNSAYSSLYQAAGVPFSSGFLVDTAAVLPPVPPGVFDDLAPEIHQNPSLRAARLRSQQAAMAARAQERSVWPSLTANASWGWSGSSLGELDNLLEHDSWSVSARLSWTLFDGFSREAAVQSARASVLRSQASLAGLESAFESSLLSSRDNLAAAHESFRLSGLALEQAQEQYRLSKLTYEMGGLSLLDLLDAEQMLSEAQASLVSARVAALVEEARLYALMGRTPRLGE